METPVQVTKSTLPPLEEYMGYLSAIFESHNLTNQGPCVRQLESRLSAFLDSPALLAVSNGTLALQLALHALQMAGKKIITTPFTYVATVSALLWEKSEPIFADIDPETLCIDPEKIAEQLERNPDAGGILPVHVFGNAADVTGIAKLASTHNLPVLYDAAHAFGSRLNGKSLFAYGDASTGSFHSTKLFHTIEGGCIATPKKADLENLLLMRAFGHTNDYHSQLGINAKMSEMHAAMGLCLLPKVARLISARAEKTTLYDQALAGEPRLRSIRLANDLEWNHAYYPLIFESEQALLKAMKKLAAEKIYPRRYFYPSLTKLPYLKPQSCPIAESIAPRILCLPLWPDMETEVIEKTTEIILNSLN